MRITDISRSRVASAMVRGYFHSFFSGQVDALYPGEKRIEPKEYKQLLVNNIRQPLYSIRVCSLSYSHTSKLFRP